MLRKYEPVTAYYLTVVRVPYNQLFLRMIRIEIVLIEVQRLTCPASRVPEGQFADAANLVHK